MDYTARLIAAEWQAAGFDWIDPANGQRVCERTAIRRYQRDLARLDPCVVDAELDNDPEFAAFLDARDSIEAHDDDAHDRAAPVSEGDLYAGNGAWVAA